MKKTVQRLFCLTIIAWAFGFYPACAQDSAVPRINPYMLFSYLKDSDSQKILQAKMTNITSTGEVPLPQLVIKFYNGTNLLGESTTDIRGNASLTIAKETVLSSAEDGTWPFSASFEGNDMVDPAAGELSITDVDLEMTLSEVDGERLVDLKAFIPAESGPVPAVGEEISVFVPTMFSLLPVATGVIEDNGTLQLRFPADLPGDSTGKITVIGRFNDHYLFGNVEKREVKSWGAPVKSPPPVYRSLWSTLAPRWMIVTLSVMLLGVWGHYAFVVISLIRIRKEGAKNAAVPEE